MERSEADRVRRMRADGLITPRQAELLERSLGTRPEIAGSAAENGAEKVGEKAGRRRTSGGIRLVLAALAAAGVVTLVAAVVGGDTGPVEVQDVSATLNEVGGTGEMNRSLMLVFVALVVAAVPVALLMWSYNGLVAREEAVLAAWGQVESNLQRRADLTPRLVESVSRYLAHERETLTAVAGQRAGGGEDLRAVIDDLSEAAGEAAETLRAPADITEDEEALERLAAAERRMGASIAALLATAEAYPELRSSDQFLELQSQLEGTENRLNVTRMRFNDEVGRYNAAIRKVPGALVAGLGRFRRKAYFQAEPEAREAPALGFQ